MEKDKIYIKGNFFFYEVRIRYILPRTWEMKDGILFKIYEDEKKTRLKHFFKFKIYGHTFRIKN